MTVKEKAKEKVHHVSIHEEKPTCCDSYAHRDTIIECSCGWEQRLQHIHSTSPSVLEAILNHRVSIIEEDLGIKIDLTFRKDA